MTASECLRYAMTLPTSLVITGCDSMAILQQGINGACTFRPMTDEERTALLARTAPPGACPRNSQLTEDEKGV